MRQAQNTRRSRGRSGGGGGGGNRRGGGGNTNNRSIDSNGPGVKIRGAASHVHEKYLSLARDAGVNGDRVMMENLYQHADHYYRVMAAQAEKQAEKQAQNAENNARNNGQQEDAQQKTQEAGAQRNGGQRRRSPRNGEGASDQKNGAKSAENVDSDDSGEAEVTNVGQTGEAQSAVVQSADGQSEDGKSEEARGAEAEAIVDKVIDVGPEETSAAG